MENKEKSFLYNWQIKIICLLMAVFVYIIFTFGKQESRIISMPLNVKMPSGYKATSIVPDKVELSLSGDNSVIYILDVSKFVVTSDFSNVDKEGVASVPVAVDTKNLSEYVDISKVNITTNPSYVKIYFEKVK